MLLERTACAGVLLSLDGKQILMDGVCREVKPYPATPLAIRQELMYFPPDALLVTHKHEDHYDEAFVSHYCQHSAGPILGPADIPFASQTGCRVGDVVITLLPSRHIGKVHDAEHCSFILQGSKCVWFLGDSSPLFWKNASQLPKPDVMIVPYAYGMGSGWEFCKSLDPQAVVLLHLPERNADLYRLWEAVEATPGLGDSPALYIPGMGEKIRIP